MRRLWEAVLNVLYPPTCCGCGRTTERPDFCTDCRIIIGVPRSPLCPSCGTPFGTVGDADHPCGRCLDRPPPFRQARACAIYDARDTTHDPLKLVLQRYKYSREISLGRPLARLLLERCPLPVPEYDVIMPVPLHLSRLRWRGFNQAYLLARTLGRAAGVPVDPVSLQRVRPTRPQVQLNERERRRNVAHAFHLVDMERVCGRRILLVDDVYTTGATVAECSRVLLRGNARDVDVLVLARAVLH